VVAYYFHTSTRCAACNAIESMSRAVVHREFAGELKSGRIEWRSVNVELRQNRHFIQRYRLHAPSVVLVRLVDDRQHGYKVLGDTWRLVRNKAQFSTYIRAEISAFLEGA
jgi:hypothetical protein